MINPSNEEMEVMRQNLVDGFIDKFKQKDYRIFAYCKEKNTYNYEQIEAFEAIFVYRKEFIGFGGAAGGGKSFVIGYILALCCLTYPGTAWCLARNTLKDLKQTTLISFYKVCRELGLRDSVDFIFKEKDSCILFPKTGCIVWLKELSYRPRDENYSNLGGLEIAGAFVDESNECPEKALTILNTRTGRSKNEEYGIKGFVFEAFNPNKNHVYNRYYKPFKDNTMPKNTVFIRALARTNPFVPDEYVEKLRNAPRIEKERLYHGNFDYDDNPYKLIPDYNKIVNMFGSMGYHRTGRFLTADIAMQGSDKFVIVLWFGLLAKKVWVKEKMPPDVMERFLKEKITEFDIPMSHVVYDADGVGAYLQGYLKGAVPFHNNAVPLTLDSGRKSKNDKYKLNYNSIKDQCYYKLCELINDGNIGIYEPDPYVRNKIIEELAVIENADPDGKKLKIQDKKKMKESLGRSPDHADALMLRMYFEVKRPRRPRSKAPTKLQKLKKKKYKF